MFRSLARDAIGELLLSIGMTSPKRVASGCLSVATFHRVLPEELRHQYPLPGLCVTPAELAWFLDFFKRNFVCGTLRECHERMQSAQYSNAPLLAITFDDAQLDNYEFARPILKRAGLSASFFIPTGSVESTEPLWHDRVGFSLSRLRFEEDHRVRDLLAELGHGGDPFVSSPSTLHFTISRLKLLSPTDRGVWLGQLEASLGRPVVPNWAGMMSWEQVVELAREGHEIGSHSVTHPILPRCSRSEVNREVTISKSVLEEKVCQPVDSFCYPNGDFDDQSIAAVEAAGYARAVTTAWGMNTMATSRYCLRRFDMCAEHVKSKKGNLSESRLAWRMSGYYPGLR